MAKSLKTVRIAPLQYTIHSDHNEANLHYKWQSHLATCFGCRQSRCKVWNSPNQTHWNLVHLPHLGPHLRSGKLSFWIITIFFHCRTNLDLARGVYCCAMFGDCDTFLPRHFLPTNHPWQSFWSDIYFIFSIFCSHDPRHPKHPHRAVQSLIGNWPKSPIETHPICK